MAEVLYRVDVGFACFGMLVRDGIVVDVATIAYWAKSKPVEHVLAWAERRGGTWQIVSEGPTTAREEFVEAYTSCMPSTPPKTAAKVFDTLVGDPSVRRRLSQAIRAVRAEEEEEKSDGDR